MCSLFVVEGVTACVSLPPEVPPQSEDGVNFGGTMDGSEASELPSNAEAAREIENVLEPKFVYYGA